MLPGSGRTECLVGSVGQELAPLVLREVAARHHARLRLPRGRVEAPEDRPARLVYDEEVVPSGVNRAAPPWTRGRGSPPRSAFEARSQRVTRPRYISGRDERLPIGTKVDVQHGFVGAWSAGAARLPVSRFQKAIVPSVFPKATVCPLRAKATLHAVSGSTDTTRRLRRDVPNSRLLRTIGLGGQRGSGQELPIRAEGHTVRRVRAPVECECVQRLPRSGIPHDERTLQSR